MLLPADVPVPEASKIGPYYVPSTTIDTGFFKKVALSGRFSCPENKYIYIYLYDVTYSIADSSIIRR